MLAGYRQRMIMLPGVRREGLAGRLEHCGETL
jgi:hypothetical protein